MPLRFLRNRAYTPVKAIYFTLFAYNQGKLWQIAFFNSVQGHAIFANHLNSVCTTRR
jgi:hypothetical protein